MVLILLYILQLKARIFSLYAEKYLQIIVLAQNARNIKKKDFEMIPKRG